MECYEKAFRNKADTIDVIKCLIEIYMRIDDFEQMQGCLSKLINLTSDDLLSKVVCKN
ncbi:MAG: hypothetical protein L6422_04010 [Candidatus Marinimicrobia bacterium]|nr:hypothetical protein [Candidatus Neomarinimicrobiota bacterium]